MSRLNTMFLLLGQSVQDSAGGKDALSAFAVRLAMFMAFSVYACAGLVVQRQAFAQWLQPRQPDE